MTLITYIPFTINTEGSFAEQFLDLRGGYFSFNIPVENESYKIKVFPNFYFETVDITIYDQADNLIISNIPFNFSNNINYLIGSIAFNNYSLIYNFKNKRFEFYSLN